MEMIRISDCKLKVMLTASDMNYFDLTEKNFEEGTCLHRSFKRLLEEIRKQTDFDPDTHELSVQYFPSREGGCEMFISHLNEQNEEKKCTALRPTVRQIGAFRKEYAFCFSGMEELLLACKRLNHIGYIGKSDASLDEKEHCHLIFQIETNTPFSIPDEYSFLSEYGKSESVAEAKRYLAEHGNVIRAGDAVATLSRYI